MTTYESFVVVIEKSEAEDILIAEAETTDQYDEGDETGFVTNRHAS